jgi:hypothetical protein
MHRFPIYHLIPLDQGYAELSKSSSHEGGGGDVRPGRRRGGSSSGKGLQQLHRRPAQASVGLHAEGSEGAACHLSTSTVLAELGGVPRGCCRTCRVCCLPGVAVGGRVER